MECVCLFLEEYPKEGERETSEERSGCKGHHRPQNHPNSEHTRSRERERELLFSSVVVFILWTTAFLISQSAKRGTCAASHLNSFWIENLI